MSDDRAYLRTLFLHPPSYEGFDGGAGARYQARREIRSFWYPTWLAQPAALVPGSRLIDAPPDDLTLDDVRPMAVDYDLAVLHTSTPSFAHDVRVAAALKTENPALRIGFVGAHVAVNPERALSASTAIDFVARNEFDFTIKEVAEGRRLNAVLGLSFQSNGTIRHTPDRPVLENMDALPFARPRRRALRDWLSAASVRVALHGTGLPVEMHVLSVAADGRGTSVSHAQHRARRRRDRACHAVLPPGARVLFRRRHADR